MGNGNVWSDAHYYPYKASQNAAELQCETKKINLHEYVAASFSPGMLTFSIRDNTIVSFRVNIAWWGMPVGG